jgi:hypothetical protein
VVLEFERRVITMGSRSGMPFVRPVDLERRPATRLAQRLSLAGQTGEPRWRYSLSAPE